jgi:hypothetical protein
MAPAAAAFVVVGSGDGHAVILPAHDCPGDEQFGQIGLRRAFGHQHLRFQPRSQHLFAAQRLDRLVHRGPQRAQFGPAVLFHHRDRHHRPFEQVHAVAAGEARLPHFLRGEDQHRRGIAHQRVEQHVEHGAIGAALGIGRRVAIERSLRISKKNAERSSLQNSLSART